MGLNLLRSRTLPNTFVFFCGGVGLYLRIPVFSTFGAIAGNSEMGNPKITNWVWVVGRLLSPHWLNCSLILGWKTNFHNYPVD